VGQERGITAGLIQQWLGVHGEINGKWGEGDTDCAQEPQSGWDVPLTLSPIFEIVQSLKV
jgi:hypothetical protein